MANVTDAQYALVSIAKIVAITGYLVQICACTGADYETVQSQFVEYAKNHNGDPIQLAARVSRLAALGDPLPWHDPCAPIADKLDVGAIEHVYGGRCVATERDDK